jgi:hypothetical protein
VSIDGPRFYFNDYSDESKRFQHKGLNFNLKVIAMEFAILFGTVHIAPHIQDLKVSSNSEIRTYKFAGLYKTVRFYDLVHLVIRFGERLKCFDKVNETLIKGYHMR